MGELREFDMLIDRLVAGKPPRQRWKRWLWRHGWVRGEEYSADEVAALARQRSAEIAARQSVQHFTITRPHA